MAWIVSEGADVFTQLCTDANAVTQLRKDPAYWLIMAQLRPVPDATFPLYSWSQFTQGLLETFRFSCVASSELLGRCKATAVPHPSISSLLPPHTFIAKTSTSGIRDGVHSLACGKHIRAICFLTFSPWYLWTEMPLRWTQSVGWVFYVEHWRSSGCVG